MVGHVVRAAAGAILASVAACSGELPSSSGPSRFEENWSYGVNCGGLQQHLVRDSASWKALWEQTHPDGEPVPYVNFHTDSVVAVCASFNYGEWYEITAWEPGSAGEVVVHDTRVGSGSNCVGGMMLTSGFHALRIDGTFQSASFETVDAGQQACSSTLDSDDAPGWKPLADDSFSGCTEASERLIRSEEEWAAFWTLVHANLAEEPARPAVDFTSESVVATCLGTRQDGGFATRLMHMTEPDQDARVIVGVRDYVAAANCGEEAFTPAYQAFHMIRVNRPLAGVTFRRRTVVFSCGG